MYVSCGWVKKGPKKVVRFPFQVRKGHQSFTNAKLRNRILGMELTSITILFSSSEMNYLCLNWVAHFFYFPFSDDCINAESSVA